MKININTCSVNTKLISEKVTSLSLSYDKFSLIRTQGQVRVQGHLFQKYMWIKSSWFCDMYSLGNHTGYLCNQVSVKVQGSHNFDNFCFYSKKIGVERCKMEIPTVAMGLFILYFTINNRNIFLKYRCNVLF